MTFFRLWRLLAWAFAGACLAWAFLDPRFRDAEGFLRAQFGLPASMSVALFVLGWAAIGRLSRFAFWLALALVGQAVALQLIDAGPLIHYQHYKPLDRLLAETPPLLLIYLAAQAVLVAAGLRSRWPKIRPWLGSSFKVWQLVAVGLAFVLSSATVSRQVPVYAAEVIFAALVQAVNLANIVLMAWALPEDVVTTWKQRFDAWIGQPGQETAGRAGGLDRFAVASAVWVAALAAALSFFVYERHPHIPDEVVYLIQARFLAQGALTLPAPPVPEAFEIYLMQVEGNRWYPVPPAGWPAVLALGTLVGAPWLVNPLLAGLNVLLAYILIQEIYDRRTARLVLLLLCISPWHVFMAMNFMTHTLTLTCALLGAVALIRARLAGKGQALWGMVAGLAVGMASLIRPLDGVIVAIPLGLWAIGIGGRRLKVVSLAAFALGVAALGALVLPYNRLLTGDPARFPIMVYTDEHFGRNANAYGFGPDRGMGWPIDPFPGHGPLDALVNANLNTFQLNTELFGWSTGSLVLIALMLFCGTLRRSDYLMLAVIAVNFVTYFFYYFSGGPDFGARYWYLMLIPLITLAIGGIRVLERKFESGLAGVQHAAQGFRVTIAVLVLSGFTLVNYLPWRALDKYHHYLRMRPDIRYLAQEYRFEKSLVLIRGNEHPDYASAAVYNPLDLRQENAPVYAWDRNPEVRAQVLQVYADRPVWIVEGPSITAGAYIVVAGPLPASELAAPGNSVSQDVP